MKHYMNPETGSVDTEAGWVESYEAMVLEEIDLTAEQAMELEEINLTAQQAFDEDCGSILIEVEKDADNFWVEADPLRF